jgi:CHASE2 domain-containing sensor protein
MKQLNDIEQAFIDRRRRLIRWWPPALLLLVIMLAGTYLFLFFAHPGLANPSFITAAVQAGTLSAEVMLVAAVLLPVVVCLLFLVVAVMLLLLHVTVMNERRYQAIIGKLR